MQGDLCVMLCVMSAGGVVIRRWCSLLSGGIFDAAVVILLLWQVAGNGVHLPCF